MQTVKARLGKVLARFKRDREASVAVEFGMLAIPFALVIFAVLESCVSFAAQQVMSNATDDIARQIRTGQLKGLTESQLKTKICDQMKIVVTASCSTNLFVDLRTYNTFAEAAAIKIKVVNGQLDTSGFAVTPGGSMTRNMLRVFYKWPILTDVMRYKMSNMSDRTVLHIATATWKNEPFDD
jgi:Flp pilus assembly protein TadG